MLTAGIDIGSVATKTLILRDGNVVGKSVVRSTTNQRQDAESTLADAVSEASVDRADIGSIVTTGYGRRSIGFGDKVITEISAAAKGAFFLGAPWGKPKLLADLGGQDTKVILLDDDGSILDFKMNDKCAAGTGRFLEVMAKVLEVSLEEMGQMSLCSTSPAKINSTCTVFAESEVISLISSGRAKEDIIAGLHMSVASRITTMLRQMGNFDVFFSGGGARNKGVCKCLEDALGHKLYVPPDPQFVVALGAALPVS